MLNYKELLQKYDIVLTDDDKRIFNMKIEGYTDTDICKLCGYTSSFVKYRTNIKYEECLQKRYAKYASDKEFEEMVINIVPNANSLNNICNLLGLRGVEGYYTKIQKIIDKYNLDISHFGTKNSKCYFKEIDDDEFFVDGVNRNGQSVIKRLILHSYKEHKCERCNRTEWEGQKIPLHLHHINGIHSDNRLNNLMLLCPNCHALTDNFCKKKNNVISKKETVYDKIHKEILSKKDEYNLRIKNIVDDAYATHKIDFAEYGWCKKMAKILNENGVECSINKTRSFLKTHYPEFFDKYDVYVRL